MKSRIDDQLHNSDRGAYVADMFARIAPRYDLMNRIMTAGLDKKWRAICVAEARLQPGSAVLDVATGTGDLALTMASVVGASGRVVGVDFTPAMLTIAKAKILHVNTSTIPDFRSGDATSLAFDDSEFDAVTIGFGLRNIANKEAALAEMLRVVRPGGRVVCLELTPPRIPILASIFYAYFDTVVPLVGGIVNGSREAYTYLPSSIRYFPQANELRQMMLDTGFASVHMRLLNVGTIAVHVGRRAR